MTEQPSPFDSNWASYEELVSRSVAASGEDCSYFAEYKARYLAQVLGSDFTGRLLDYGCGSGTLTSALHRHLPGARLHGFDLSADGIDRVRARLGESGAFTTNPDELRHDYDAIVVANVLHHITPARRRAVVGDLAARLASGGHVVVFEHNPAHPLTRYAVSRCPLDADAVLLWPRETRGLLVDAGFTGVHRDYVVFFPRRLSWLRALEPRLGWLPVGAQYVVSARARSRTR